MIPSLCYEGMPRVALEAFSAGVPVIASAAGALPEIVTNGHTGLLVRPGDTVGWRDAVNRLGCDSLSQQARPGGVPQVVECVQPRARAEEPRGRVRACSRRQARTSPLRCPLGDSSARRLRALPPPSTRESTFFDQ